MSQEDLAKPQIRELRDAFGAFMTGVTIVTTRDEHGQPLGFTANSFASVSLEPALLLVNIAKSSRNYPVFASTRHFAINVLAEGQKNLSNTFAQPCENRFAQVKWTVSGNQNPLLDEVSAWFDCLTHAVIEAGDHAILVGKVAAFQSTGYAGLGYYRGGYFTPAQLSAEVIAGPKTVISAIIAHEDHLLLRQSEDGHWELPSREIGRTGADKALADLFRRYQPAAAASFIYAAYHNTETQHQYITFLCNTPDGRPLAGEFVRLDRIESSQFRDRAVASMLERYRKERQLNTYGSYFGDHRSGTVCPAKI